MIARRRTPALVKSQLLTLGKQTLIYGLGNVAVQAVGLVTLPVFARVFSQAEYGVLELATVTLAALAILADAGLASASQRSWFDYTDEQRIERRVVMSTAIIVSLVASGTICAVLVLAREPVSEWLFAGQQYTTLVVLLAAALPLTILAQLLRELMRLRFRAWHYMISASLGAALTGFLGVGAVLFVDAGLEGVLWGVVIGTGAAALYGLVVVRADLGARVSSGELRTMLAYGLPLVPAALALWALTFIDRLMLARLSDLAEVGEYAVANRVAMPLLFAVAAFATAFSPFILAAHTEDPEAEKDLRSRVLTYVTAGLVLMALAIGLFAREIVDIIAPEFDSAYRATGLVAAGLAAFGVSTITMTGLSITRRTVHVAVAATLVAAVNVGLNLLLIPPWGMMGAAVATLIAYVLLAVLYHLQAQRAYRTHYDLRTVLALSALGGALIPLGAVDLHPIGLALALKTAALAVFVLVLVRFGIVRRAEVAEVTRAFRLRAGAW
jgi:O-antigen/teichoic acid export membrane protein